jgi:hypothetical protein
MEKENVGNIRLIEDNLHLDDGMDISFHVIPTVEKVVVEGSMCSGCRGDIEKITKPVYRIPNVYGPASFNAAKIIIGYEVSYKCKGCGMMYELTEASTVGIPREK